MAFMKHLIAFLTSWYNLILTAILIVVYLVMAFWVKIDMTTENATWVYSSSMQTLAALIALLPISYGYYINNLELAEREDYDTYVIDRLKRDVYYDMMTVIVYSLIVIILNLIGLFTEGSMLSSFVIALLTIEGIGLIAMYIYRLFDPRKVREILKEFDQTSPLDPNQKNVSLDTFITTYLELETAVKDFISNENDNELIDKLPLYDIVDNLSKDFPILEDNYTTFKEIIFHRNNLIHNYMDTVVDYNKFKSMIQLKQRFDRLNDGFIRTNIFSNVGSIRLIIESVLKEYLLDRQKELVDIGNVLEDYKEDIVSLLHSYFINDYYDTLSLEDARDADFEIVQNNYSKRHLVGIDIKSIDGKNIQSIARRFFSRLDSRFMYLFLINFQPEMDQLSIMYQTKDKVTRSAVVQLKGE